MSLVGIINLDFLKILKNKNFFESFSCLKLLNICAQLQARAANIYKDWSETNENIKIDETATKTTELWSKYWRPLMQSIARMACDCRRLIRKQALEALGVIIGRNY